MPGLVIHVAIAKEYIKKHSTEIKNKKEFLKGTVAPDLCENKITSHYGKWENYNTEIYLKQFLNDKKVDLNIDYWKGYFLHLYTDEIFYNKYFRREFEKAIKNKDAFYNDYNILDDVIAKDYNINKQSFFKETNRRIIAFEGKTKYLDYSKIKKMINIISKKSINDEIQKIKKEGSI